jgi:hypothetical protein
MKLLVGILFFISASNVIAGGVCNDVNTHTKIARDAVKALVALADVPNVIAYYGGVESDSDSAMVVHVQPHYQYTKDWYKVTVRKSDCRVLGATLFQEDVPL